MFIGGLVGFAVFSVLSMLSISALQAEVNRHNKALGGNLARYTGKAKLNINYPFVIAGCFAFTSVGAVIGYFI